MRKYVQGLDIGDDPVYTRWEYQNKVLGKLRYALQGGRKYTKQQIRRICDTRQARMDRINKDIQIDISNG